VRSIEADGCDHMGSVAVMLVESANAGES
jgi:hypothetical protein